MLPCEIPIFGPMENSCACTAFIVEPVVNRQAIRKHLRILFIGMGFW
jgi:hypothetical protein